jgi:hypothetical protein
VSTRRWLGKRALLKPKLRLAKRPRVGRHGRLRIHIRTLPETSIKIRVRGRGKLLGSKRLHANRKGVIATSMALRPYSGKKLRIRSKARFELYGEQATKIKVRRIGLSWAERSRL